MYANTIPVVTFDPLRNYFRRYGHVAYSTRCKVATLMTAIILAWLLHLAEQFNRDVPVVAQTECYIIMMFIAIDTLTGVASAALSKTLRSRRLRNHMFAKTMQYTGLVGLSCAPGMLLHNWLPPEAAGMAVIMFEALSIVENMHRLEIVGRDMGPARPLIAFFARYMDSSASDIDQAAIVGRTGARGPAGATGLQGIPGVIGPTGQQGPPGPTV